MAKTLASKKIVEVDGKQFIRNFNRYGKDKRLTLFEGLIKGIKDKDVLSLEDFNPGYIDPVKDDVLLAKGRGIIIIIIIHGPFPIPRPKPGPAGPCFQETFTSVVNAKDAKFYRFSKNDIQHLQVKSAKASVEVISLK